MKVTAISQKMLADLATPVGVYLKTRDKFSNPALLESSDYRSKEDSLSFICLDPIASFKSEKGLVYVEKEGVKVEKSLSGRMQLAFELEKFARSIQVSGEGPAKAFNGLFGYTSFEAVQQFEGVVFDDSKAGPQTPDMLYFFYRYLIVFNHFNNEMFLIQNLLEGETDDLARLRAIVEFQDCAGFPFSLEGEEGSNLTDEGFKALVSKGKEHCQRGDVFQIVLSRRFSQKFKGDEFNVYRALRSVNPSPYLFYFDFGDYKIFGSSPEAQIVAKGGIAQIHPIAGTYRRTGDDETDKKEAVKLSEDPKENAEHVMLVDLARNDLSKSSTNVKVEKYREIQYFSHVIHLVSKVTGQLQNPADGIRVFADTFPAGTLSGAPKFKALELIDKYENTKRGFYGGAIGYISLNGDINHAIVIRSFLSIQGELHYQAGAGVVINSKEDGELQEVNNKLAALKKALLIAQGI